VQSVQDPDTVQGLAAFDDAFCGHVAFSISNLTGAFFHNVTLGLFAEAPERSQGLEPIYKQLSRASRNFALVADLTVALLGGGLKVKQKLTGRLADALSEIYLTSCVLKRFEDDGRPEADRAIVAFAAANGLHRFEEALRGTIENFPNPVVRALLRVVVFPFGRHYYPAPDALGSKIVRLVLQPGDVRDRLTRDIYISEDPDDATGLLEVTLKKVVATEEAEKKLERAIRAGTVRRYHGLDWIEAAAEAGSITESEAQQLREAETLTQRVIAVDHFAPEELMPHYRKAAPNLGHNSRGISADTIPS
jgi:acyl-CoA dehydrogenase